MAAAVAVLCHPGRARWISAEMVSQPPNGSAFVVRRYNSMPQCRIDDVAADQRAAHETRAAARGRPGRGSGGEMPAASGALPFPPIHRPTPESLPWPQGSSPRCRGVSKNSPGSFIVQRPLDVVVVDYLHRQLLGKPQLTLATDVATRCTLGFVISSMPPGADTVSASDWPAGQAPIRTGWVVDRGSSSARRAAPRRRDCDLRSMPCDDCPTRPGAYLCQNASTAFIRRRFSVVT